MSTLKIKKIFNYIKFFIFLISCISANQLHSQDLRIKKIQEILTFQGFSVGEADGIAGKKTIKAIKNWQFLNYHKETGVLTNQQFEDLKAQYVISYRLDKSSLQFLENRNVVVDKKVLKQYDTQRVNKKKSTKRNTENQEKKVVSDTNEKKNGFFSVIINALKSLSKSIAFKVLSYI